MIWFLAEIINGCHRLCNRITLLDFSFAPCSIYTPEKIITMGWSSTCYTHRMVLLYSFSKCVNAPISYIWYANGRAVRYIHNVVCTEHRSVRINCDSTERIITSYRMRIDHFPLESYSTKVRSVGFSGKFYRWGM